MTRSIRENPASKPTLGSFNHPVVVLLFLGFVGGLYGLYRLGFGGIFSFDDASTLEPLLTVENWSSAIYYFMTGDAGPLGRPIALASFLLDAPGYPYSAEGFLYTNTLIHLVNVCLVALVLLRLQRLAPETLPTSPWFPLLTALFWGMLPLLASTSMLVVQRMTSLSALFVLLGVWIYLWGRAHQARPAAVVVAILGIGTCTLLAAFSKENGALLPLLLVVIELTLLSGARGRNGGWAPRLLRWSILLPSLLALGYLASMLPGLARGYVVRPFSLAERGATELVILWDYLRHAFIPRPLALGPFHDDYPIYDFASPLVWAALAAWVMALALALWHRRAYPLFAFAVLWYLVGHLLESTVFPLELYFEHRNYLPILGPVIALAALSTRLPIRPQLRAGLSGLYLAFLAFVLWQTLSIWGNRHHELWARQHPDSPRAVQLVAQTYYEAGRREESLRMLEEAWLRNPHLSSLGMQALRLRCYRDGPEGLAALRDGLIETLADSHFSYLTLFAFEKMVAHYEAGGCRGMQGAGLQRLADSMLANPRFAARGATRERLHRMKARVSIHEGQLAAAAEELNRAFAAKATPENLLQLYGVLRNTGQTQAIPELLDRAAAQAPSNPWVKQGWMALIETLRADAQKNR